MNEYSVYVISNKPQYFLEIQKAAAPEQISFFDGTGIGSFAKLVNTCVASASTEIVILLSDKVRPSAESIQKTVRLINQGYGFVALYRFGFFGFKKELMRQIGVMDEGFAGGGFEDDDFYLRLREANISMYATEEVPYDNRPSSWNSEITKPYFIEKWVDTTWENYNPNGKMSNNRIERKIPEPPHAYDLGPARPTPFLSWDYTVVETFRARKFARLSNKSKRKTL